MVGLCHSDLRSEPLMAQVIITKGLPSSGKTTWARSVLAAEPGRYKRVNKDELRAMLDSSRHSKDNEAFIEAVRDHLILAALAAGKDVIVDDTNLDSRHETHIRRMVEDRAEVVVKVFDVGLDECIERDRARVAPVGERVIRQMHRDYIFFSAGEARGGIA